MKGWSARNTAGPEGDPYHTITSPVAAAASVPRSSTWIQAWWMTLVRQWFPVENLP